MYLYVLCKSIMTLKVKLFSSFLEMHILFPKQIKNFHKSHYFSLFNYQLLNNSKLFLDECLTVVKSIINIEKIH